MEPLIHSSLTYKIAEASVFPICTNKFQEEICGKEIIEEFLYPLKNANGSSLVSSGQSIFIAN